MGMTYEQFWNEDCELVVFYRKAYRIRQEDENRMAWLQGLYMYKALNSSLLHVNGFVPKGVNIEPYLDRPIQFSKKEKKKPVQEVNRQKTEDTINFMNVLMNRFNASNQDKREKNDREGELQNERDTGA